MKAQTFPLRAERSIPEHYRDFTRLEPLIDFGGNRCQKNSVG